MRGCVLLSIFLIALPETSAQLQQHDLTKILTPVNLRHQLVSGSDHNEGSLSATPALLAQLPGVPRGEAWRHLFLIMLDFLMYYPGKPMQMKIFPYFSAGRITLPRVIYFPGIPIFKEYLRITMDQDPSLATGAANTLAALLSGIAGHSAPGAFKAKLAEAIRMYGVDVLALALPPLVRWLTDNTDRKPLYFFPYS